MMRIKHISVNNLFEIFDHNIPMKMDDHITIIHGPNGLGKTVVLKLINALFSSHYYELTRIPFSELIVEFDDKSKLTVKKSIHQLTEEEDRHLSSELTLEFKKYRSATKSFTIKPIRQKEINFPMSMLEREIAGLERIGQELWLYLPTQEKMTLDEVLDRFHDRLPIHVFEKNKEPEWLKEIRSFIPVRFIETQRLLSFSYSRRQREFERPAAMVPAVVKYSEELANAIQEKLAEYATLSQSLDRTFPSRLIQKSGTYDLTIEELRKDLNELEEKRTRLMSAGLLDKEKEIDLKGLQKLEETNRSVLSVYINDVKQKLSVFDELTNKIDLLIKIINSRFLYKQLSISKKEGFVFRSFQGKPLSPTNLSSGEQHELVLLYELLFKVHPNSMILIDEPELSLHVVWQQQFLKDLQEVAKLSGFDVLIATHSPQIVHDRSDLMVELKGPQNA